LAINNPKIIPRREDISLKKPLKKAFTTKKAANPRIMKSRMFIGRF